MAEVLKGHMRGARLEFVLRPLKGTVTRDKHSWDPSKKKVIATPTKQDAGYMLYLPSGHSYRLTQKEVDAKGYDRMPSVINLDQVNDTTTPAGRYKHAIRMEDREKAWIDLEEQVIRACVRKHGPVVKKETANDGATA